MALNSLICADVPLRNCSLTHSLTHSALCRITHKVYCIVVVRVVVIVIIIVKVLEISL